MSAPARCDICDRPLCGCASKYPTLMDATHYAETSLCHLPGTLGCTIERVDWRARVAAAEAEAHRLRTRVAAVDALLDLLGDIEWENTDDPEYFRFRTCRQCFGGQPKEVDNYVCANPHWSNRNIVRDHTPDCKLSAALVTLRGTEAS